MRLIRCEKGHFFDAEKYQSCPHCAGMGVGYAGGDTDVTESFTDPGYGTGGNGYYTDQSNATVTGAFDEPYNNSYPPQQPAYPPYPPEPPVQPRYTAPPVDDYPRGPVEDYKDESFTEDDDDNKTIGLINMGAIGFNEQQKQAGKAVLKDNKRLEDVKPVTGWLVCTSGTNLGRSFNLYTGKNFIGRDESNDICLAGDRSVSRYKHAVVAYEPIQRRFYAAAGDAHELFYLNGDAVLSSVLLTDRDVIKIGETELVFVPFCDERYGWEVKSKDE